MTPSRFEIRLATRDDRAAVLDLMKAAGLAIQGVRADLLGFHLAESPEGSVLGVACLEYYGREGLLRSVGTHPDARGQGIGQDLVRAVESTAVAEGLQRMVLLTTDAMAWFTRLGYIPVPWDSAGVYVQRSSQFAGGCPTSAVAMIRSLTAPTGE